MMFAFFVAAASAGDLDEGRVVSVIARCDYFLVETSSGYSLIQDFYGKDKVSTGDRVLGDINSFGFTDLVINGDTDDTLRVWLDDYGLSKARAYEKQADKCQR